MFRPNQVTIRLIKIYRTKRGSTDTLFYKQIFMLDSNMSRINIIHYFNRYYTIISQVTDLSFSILEH